MAKKDEAPAVPLHEIISLASRFEAEYRVWQRAAEIASELVRWHNQLDKVERQAKEAEARRDKALGEIEAAMTKARADAQAHQQRVEQAIAEREDQSAAGLTEAQRQLAAIVKQTNAASEDLGIAQKKLADFERHAHQLEQTITARIAELGAEEEAIRSRLAAALGR